MSSEAEADILEIERDLRRLSPEGRAFVAQLVAQMAAKRSLAGDAAVASEKVLAQDWLRATEDEAWSDL